MLPFGHGGAHSKDSTRFVRLSRTYADRTGLAVVCIDAVDHGERKPEGLSAGLPPVRSMLLGPASKLDHPQVLMLNMTNDEVFSIEDAHVFFDVIPGRKKRLVFWEGDHDEWPAEAIEHSIALINEYT